MHNSRIAKNAFWGHILIKETQLLDDTQSFAVSPTSNPLLADALQRAQVGRDQNKEVQRLKQFSICCKLHHNIQLQALAGTKNGLKRSSEECLPGKPSSG